MKYILALDIGVASVGWAVIDKETETVVEACSNIFPEASAAENQLRREMRQGRRGKRRRKTRLDDFNKLWKKNDLSIPDFKSNKIVELKVKALREEISLDELYLILYSYLKHRGISYLEDALDDSVSGAGIYANGLEDKYPCEIQKERLEKSGKYRGQTQITDDNGEKVYLSNVFTIGSYRKEILKVFETQRKYHDELSDELCDEYILIFNRKRKYYEGPGNEKSRTDYGRYTTKIDENGNYINEDNIFEKLIGKCSVYPEELREEIDKLNVWLFENVNNAVYRAQFAESLQAFKDGYETFFAGLEAMDKRLENQRFLFGDYITDSDIRLYTTLARFDYSYSRNIGPCVHRLVDYKNLWPYARDLYQIPAFRHNTYFKDFAASEDLTHAPEDYWENVYYDIVVQETDWDTIWSQPTGREALSKDPAHKWKAEI